jgi:pyruvate dehydrogenase complex dehydrogenase (E1) component
VSDWQTAVDTSETWAALRRFFAVDADSIAQAAMRTLKA